MEPNRKQKVMDAAIELFNAKGFDGTSVRDIAFRAGVNVALISYHFGGKKALLEKLMTTFYEGYTNVIEKVCRPINDRPAQQVLLEIIEHTLRYQQEHIQLARFVHREVTLDSMLVREVMTTYLSKERYCFERVFKAGMKRHEFRHMPVDFLVLQLRELMLMPYLHPQYIREVYHLMPQEAYFQKRYFRYLQHWVETSICENEVKDHPNNKWIAQG